MTGTAAAPRVGVVMGSRSDWETMQHAADVLRSWACRTRCGRLRASHAGPAVSLCRRGRGRGIQVIIAGAGGAAHLPGMLAAKTRLPVLGVPVQSKALNGMDSLLSIAQMPAGIPVGTLAIGRAGAVNAGLLAPPCWPARSGAGHGAGGLACTPDPGRARAAGSAPVTDRRQPVLGILGGGQLARMLALAAAPLGVKTLVVDSSPDACAGQVAPLAWPTGPITPRWKRFAARSTWSPSISRTCRPKRRTGWPSALRYFPIRGAGVAQDRLAEKTLFRECGLQTPEFMAVDTREDLDQALAGDRRAGDSQDTPARLRRQGPVPLKQHGRCRCGMGRAGRTGESRMD
jgi:5-(carboxyamino)imidazole ribonucleotide mutase